MKKFYTALTCLFLISFAKAQTIRPEFPYTNGPVRTIAKLGDILYIGGDFTSIGGLTRNRLAALDVNTGAVLSWNPNANGRVRKIAVNNNFIYIGGEFTQIGGQSRNLVARVNSNGSVDSWNLNALPIHQPSYQSFIGSFGFYNNIVYVGGAFHTINGQNRQRIAAVDLITGQPTSWNPGVYQALGGGAQVYDIVLDANKVILAGNFDMVGGTDLSGGVGRFNVAQVDDAGNVLSWNNYTNREVYALAKKDNLLYLGGAFFISGTSREHVAAVNINSPTISPWNPGANGNVYEVQVDGNTVYAGGIFTNSGGQARNNIAAIDATTGQATSWNANANDTVQTILVDGNTVFVGGSFTSITGQPRSYFAALANPVNAPLPVHLLTFNAKAEYGSSWKVALDWNTASEANSDYYNIERSTDGRKWTSIGYVSAAGNSASVRNYHFNDDDPFRGVSYYRLKQVDADGKFTYSAVAVISISGNGISVLVYPNPVKNVSKFMITSQKRKQVNYELIDSKGAIIQKGNLSIQAGTNNFNIQVSQLSKGTYYLVVNDESGPLRVKVVKE